MLLAKVVLDIATQSFEAPYTYSVPEDLEKAEVGCAVLVPLGSRKAIGFIVALGEPGSVGFEELQLGEQANGAETIKSSEDAASSEQMHFGFGAQYEQKSQVVGFKRDGANAKAMNIKPIEAVLSKPYFNEEGAACAAFLSERYVAPLATCVRLFTPPGGVPRIVRSANGKWRVEEPIIGEVDDRWVVLGPNAEEFEPRKNAIKQQAVLAAVKRGDIRMSELSLEFGSVGPAVASLEKKGVVKVERRRRMRADASTTYKKQEDTEEHELTSGQTAALKTIGEAAAKTSGQVVLVDGVTGSGKTEVYLRAIERELAQGRNAIVLVPEISLTPQTVARFRGRFGDAVAVMHSRMSQGERYDQWDFIRSGAARVVVGARSALFTPLSNVGLIVIDEEHESTYKQESAPRYVSRDVAHWMMERAGGTLVLGSATPSIEALYACKTRDTWHRVELPERANGRPLPEIEVIDMARDFSQGHRSMFSRRLAESLKSELLAGHKAVLLLNQRGFAKFLLCRDCGFVPECPHCATSLTYHERGNKLVCHQCGYTVAAPSVCPACGSPYLKKFGAGTQRVETELRSLLDAEIGILPPYFFENTANTKANKKVDLKSDTESGMPVPVIRMDADTTSTKGAHQELLERFAAAPVAVLLGTQMIAKGLDFDDVTLVGVVNADTQLHLPDYRAAERTFDLIEQVAGRAGRAGLPGRVLVQTYEADSVAIRAAAKYDREMFLRSELPKRKTFKFPPYVRMANALVWGKNEGEVKREAERIYEDMKKAVFDHGGDDWEVLPAGPCAIERRRDNFRWHVIAKCPPEGNISSVLGPVFRLRKPSKAVNVALDVDPIDLL